MTEEARKAVRRERGLPDETALGMVLPAEVAERVAWLREWSSSVGDQAACALFCAFHPGVAEIGEREDARKLEHGEFNPFGVEELKVMEARQTLIQLRNTFLLPQVFESNLAVLFSHTIAALHDVMTKCLVTGLETDGVGPETG